MRQLGGWVRGNHGLLMIICCVVPMALLAAIFAFRVPLDAIGLFAIMLLCPVMHLLMMRGMGHGEHQQQGSSHNEAATSQKPGSVKVEKELILAGGKSGEATLNNLQIQATEKLGVNGNNDRAS